MNNFYRLLDSCLCLSPFNFRGRYPLGLALCHVGDYVHWARPRASTRILEIFREYIGNKIGKKTTLKSFSSIDLLMK
jgi:hypothetical protein